jgi:hypothetical protein
MIYSIIGNWGIYLRMQKGFRAVSTLLAVLLILAAAILGGLISYMWAIAPFYATPKDVGLAITDAIFPVNHAGYFDVTVLNPSNSLGGTNITSIYLAVQGVSSIFNVTDTSPGLPIPLDQGASTTVHCNFNWGSYAGKNVTVTVFPQNGTGVSFPVQTEFVGLTANAYFNATTSVDYFYVTVFNDAASAINVTLTSVSIDTVSISSLSIALPRVLNASGSEGIQCFYDWEGHYAPHVVIGTQEGYIAEATQNVSASIGLRVSNVQFNETNTDQISVTLNSSSDSTTLVSISNITITYGNTTDVINGTLSNPAFPYPLDKNSSATFNCVWNWSDETHRNISISVVAYTSQGFASQPSTFTTPAEVASRIDQTGFDLSDTGHFTANVTNLAYSLHTVNVTEIDFNGNPTGTNSAKVAAGERAAFVCAFNWSSFVGQKANIIVHITYGANNSISLPPFQVSVPYFAVLNVSFADSSLGNPYINVTARTSEFSNKAANITSIFVQTENTTQSIDGTVSNPKISPSGYSLASGNETVIVCPWDWSKYVGKNVTVIVQTADGFQASITLIVQ